MCQVDLICPECNKSEFEVLSLEPWQVIENIRFWVQPQRINAIAFHIGEGYTVLKCCNKECGATFRIKAPTLERVLLDVKVEISV